MPKESFSPGDGTTVEIDVSRIADYPRGANGTCAFCAGDPCAEDGGDTLIAAYFQRNPRAATCPMCGGQPT